MQTHCPSCGRLWFHTLEGAGCLTRGCPHSVLRRGDNKRKPAAKPKPKPKEK